MNILKRITLFLTICAITPAVSAFPLNFTNTSNNGVTDVAGNFSLAITEVSGQSQAKFAFANTGTIESSITAIYFGQKTQFENLLTFNSLDQVFDTSTKTGVKFSEDGSASPSNPGGGIDWDAAFASDADSPSGFNKYGIDLGESITFYFDFAGATTAFSDIENGFSSGDLVVALHAQSITGENGYSDWFISDKHRDVDVPEPTTLMLLSLGLIGMVLSRRRKAV